MFCNHCGAQLSPDSQFCPKCGQPVPQVASPVAPAGVSAAPLQALQGRVQRHIGLLAALWMVNGFLRLGEVFAFTALGHLWFPMFGRWGAWGFPFHWNMWPFSLGLAWIAVYLGIFGVIHLILAWGLYERKAWARPLGLVIGFLALIRFPLGTALGIYTLWVLLPELSRREYERIAVA